MKLHAVIWIDHDEAHIIRFRRSDAESEMVKPPHAHPHHNGSTDGADRAFGFYEKVIAAANDAGDMLIVGPADAKLQLVTHIGRFHPALSARVVGVETVDHPSDGELLVHFRDYFKSADRMRAHPAMPRA